LDLSIATDLADTVRVTAIIIGYISIIARLGEMSLNHAVSTDLKLTAQVTAVVIVSVPIIAGL
jgi:hypothetical protein